MCCLPKKPNTLFKDWEQRGYRDLCPTCGADLGVWLEVFGEFHNCPKKEQGQ